MSPPTKPSAAGSFVDPAGLVDRVLELPIVPSFTRIGSAIRSRVDGWTPLDDYELDDHVMVLTGATSGIGLAAAEQLARCGATLVLVGRTAEKNQQVVDQLVASTGNTRLSQVAADMGDLEQVRELASTVLARHDRLDALLHNAGALSGERSESPGGIESTVASQVVGPFLLTSLLLQRLRASAPSRVVTMASGGMYAARLEVENLQMAAGEYKGTEQYARAKRAQVTLNEMWAQRADTDGVHFHAMHPGWADTPGVAEALPTFGRALGPLLRTPAEGADTLVWLAADSAAIQSSGRFWHDRRPRSIHKIGTTRSSDNPARRAELWAWLAAASEADRQ